MRWIAIAAKGSTLWRPKRSHLPFAVSFIFNFLFDWPLNKNKIILLLAGANPFSILYRTDGDETITATVDGVTGANVNGNLGFCLSYQLS